MSKGQRPQSVQRADYTPYPWRLDQVELHVGVHDDHTLVQAAIDFESVSGEPGDIALDAVDLEIIAIELDGEVVAEDRITREGERLVIHDAPARCRVVTKQRIHPEANTALEGLYGAGRHFLTQCEPEGFRKIACFPDRPDVMARYTVTIEANRERFPVLLSNGNLVAEGDAGNGRHWCRWEDPFPKPSYLFALVAGDFVFTEDHFTTCSGREVTLRIYVEDGNLDRCDYAMASLINAMRWDEERFGLEYDLDIYNIVATSEFNMGAMENKSLNIFNTRYVLARPDTATDIDYQGIEGVIGHEYFHNWTGNRVTCRDWFQLTLKEGLTVFRDEEFSADMQSRAVKRIQDIRDLRLRQFPEDAGPMSHPIRPDHYVEINNFYTATVYQKGATVIRMYHTLLGEEGFQEGMRLYFERHDGQAVTCDDFLAAMADANDVDLSAFSRWYAQSGTPVVTVDTTWDAAAGTLRVTLEQQTPATHDQADKQPLVIPFAIGLLSRAGEPLALTVDGEAVDGDTAVLLLEKARQSYEFSGLAEAPVPSLLRDFSAPVKVRYDYTEAELATLIAHDSDHFARWEAAQRLAAGTILDQVAVLAAGGELNPPRALDTAFAGLLDDSDADPALVAEALTLPTEEGLGEMMEGQVDVDGIHAARQFTRRSLAQSLGPRLRERYTALDDGASYNYGSDSIARRSLKNVCLSYLALTDRGVGLVHRQLEHCDNMTDSLAALRSLVIDDLPGAPEALADFAERWDADALVMDKWFVIQAIRPGHDTVGTVRDLMGHPRFSLRNPNKVRALIGAFAMLNPTGFHAPDGEGYRFLADQVIALDRINPQVAARLAGSFNRWPRYDAPRRERMKAELARIADTDGLSNDVYEIVSNALD
ncbi:aminopeptidase N [Marinihelvus fidelis]|uniref:Aminopeptidase N n=1 Tax=Marinihelvus fidelis TaxID=2613842 RepID=A0A5N0T8J4_9GAMM|nr:aminopeptidase N [Marinihelvus fidelis]KAA9131260.1 aminopeptidase N [Marinihelvus fidelis]